MFRFQLGQIIPTVFFAIIGLTGLCDLQAQQAQATLEKVEHGTYWRYLAASVKPDSPVLAICHGILKDGDDAQEVAKNYLKIWRDFANKTGAVLVAPVFNDRNFGSGTVGCPHGWGYRGLYGRHVGADVFLHEIVDKLKEMNPDFDGKLFLFGHSAGGQFVSRYVVTHPDRVHAAAISSPAWLPFPTMEDNWPRGMKPRKSSRQWAGEQQKQTVEITPDPKMFLAAAQLPVLITAGAQDLDPLRPTPSQGGDNHVERAESWAKDMTEFATSEGKESGLTCVIVPRVGHEGGKMARSTMPFLRKQFRAQRAQSKQSPKASNSKKSK